LADIFRTPVSGNIHWREIESLLNHLGAEVLSGTGAGYHIVLNGVEGVLHRPHHSGACSKQELRHIREFLASAGATPSLVEEARGVARSRPD